MTFLRSFSLPFCLSACVAFSVTFSVCAEEVQLKLKESNLTIFGELISFENGVYTIKADIGTLRIDAAGVECIGAACDQEEAAQQGGASSPTPSPALSTDKTVTLKAREGNTSLTGELIGFEQGVYFVKTQFGTLKLSANMMSCSGRACPPAEVVAGQFKLSGTRVLLERLIPALVDGFGRANGAPVVKRTDALTGQEVELSAADGQLVMSLDMISGTSTEALENLISGESELAVSTRVAREGEKTRFVSAAKEVTSPVKNETVLALDGLVIIVAPTNPVRAISEDNILRVFSGEITDWSELGGPAGPINLYVQPPESGVGSAFHDLLMAPAGKTLTSSAAVKTLDSEVAWSVLNDPKAIGYTSYSAKDTARPLEIRSACGIQTPATPFTIKTEEYPLTRRLYLYSSPDGVSTAAQGFIDYTGSQNAQKVIAEAGFVDQSVSSITANAQGLRFMSSVLSADPDVTYPQIKQMMEDLVSAERLSLTYRFEVGSSDLDTRALADIGRLAQMINNDEMRHKELLILGFTDSGGAGTSNEALSLERAEQVKQAVIAASEPDKLAQLTVSAIGYGEMSPLGCNETERGQRINRRVEVWVRDTAPK